MPQVYASREQIKKAAPKRGGFNLYMADIAITCVVVTVSDVRRDLLCNLCKVCFHCVCTEQDDLIRVSGFDFDGFVMNASIAAEGNKFEVERVSVYAENIT